MPADINSSRLRRAASRSQWFTAAYLLLAFVAASINASGAFGADKDPLSISPYARFIIHGVYVGVSWLGLALYAWVVVSDYPVFRSLALDPQLPMTVFSTVNYVWFIVWWFRQNGDETTTHTIRPQANDTLRSLFTAEYTQLMVGIVYAGYARYTAQSRWLRLPWRQQEAVFVQSHSVAEAARTARRQLAPATAQQTQRRRHV